MQVYAVIYECGCSTGYKEFVVVFSSPEKADEISVAREKKYDNGTGKRKIVPIEVDEIVERVYVEW